VPIVFGPDSDLEAAGWRDPPLWQALLSGNLRRRRTSAEHSTETSSGRLQCISLASHCESRRLTLIASARLPFHQLWNIGRERAAVEDLNEALIPDILADGIAETATLDLLFVPSTQDC
jgi:hypothetical protein